MQRIHAALPADLYGAAASRRIEQACAVQLPPHTLMRRAGLAVARLAAALAPHARTIWIACGPGNNGGDGFEAAAQLAQRGFQPMVSFAGDAARLPPDAQDALARARAAGVPFGTDAPAHYDLGIDALLGLGATRAPDGQLAAWLARLYDNARPVLAVDLPSGLDAGTGASSFDFGAAPAGMRHCLSLLTLKPGLFTGHGRDACGDIWFDDLQADAAVQGPDARLGGAPAARLRPHASHKGSWGDVAVIGGAPGMAGAALLAATAALHQGAGRVFLALLDPSLPRLMPQRPELMLREPRTLPLDTLTVVCGCGAGTELGPLLAQVLAQAPRAVVDADALNAIAANPALQRQLAERLPRGQATVLTPHPLEAARLLGIDTAAVQRDRLAAAQSLAQRYRAAVVLKGSGSIVAAPEQVPFINVTGNARLATGGSGDVLAGMIGAGLAAGLDAMNAAREATWRHGALADAWPAARAFTAGALAEGGA